jgi:hypothetical protein
VRSRSSGGSIGVSFDLIISLLLPLPLFSLYLPELEAIRTKRRETGRTLGLPFALQSPTFALQSHVE